MSKQLDYVSDNIKKLIKERGLRVKFVAKKIGVSDVHIYLLMNGTAKPSLDMLGKLADFFDVPISDFFKEPQKEQR